MKNSRWFRMTLLSICTIILLSGSPLFAGSVTYNYDEFNRLIQVIYDDGTTITYTYDKVGNRRIKDVTSPLETISPPSTPTGPGTGETGKSYSYSAEGAQSVLGHDVQYLFDWGDGTDSGWLPVGQTSASKTWTSAGAKSIKAQARCATHSSAVSSWSSPISIIINLPKTPLNDTTEFVKQQYRDFLNREAEAGGLAYWVDQIDSGATTKAQVIDSFLRSQEFEGRVAPIVRLYFAYFLRIPDYGGLLYWISQYGNGTLLASISEAFASSPEFQARYGSLSDGDFVTLVYQNVLGRNPDPGGYAHWLGQLSSGAQSRGQVMLGFSESTEYKGLIGNEVLVTMMYVGMLRRSPEQGGFDYWVWYLDSGNSELALIDGFLNSQEYANRFLAFLDWGRYYVVNARTSFTHRGSLR